MAAGPEQAKGREKKLEAGKIRQEARGEGREEVPGTLKTH